MSEALLAADSGPLIALARLGLLALPSRRFREALVTATVWYEVTREPDRAEWPALDAARRADRLRLVDDPADLPPPIGAGAAGCQRTVGHRAALTQGAVVLVDEKRGRRVATSLGLHVLGTLGLLVRASEAGMMPRVRPLTDALLQSGCHLSRPLVERLLAAIGE